MLHRSSVTAFALIVAGALGWLLTSQPATVRAHAPAGRGKCVGIAIQALLVFRAFEDGTIEAADVSDGLPGKPWRRVGQ
jgi:hypothetical protein